MSTGADPHADLHTPLKELPEHSPPQHDVSALGGLLTALSLDCKMKWPAQEAGGRGAGRGRLRPDRQRLKHPSGAHGSLIPQEGS